MRMTSSSHPIDLYNPVQAEAMVRVLESASQVRRRHHFFNWSQNVLQAFLPHQVAVCAAYHRQRRALVFEAYYSVPVPPLLLDPLQDAQSPLLQQVTANWVAMGGRSTAIHVPDMAQRIGGELAAALDQAHLGEWLVHGVSRPHRPAEVESLFILAAPAGQRWREQHHLFFELLLPHIHSTYLRVQVIEREMAAAPQPVQPVREPSALVTQRECEILRWVREGMNNQQIGEQLGISALTVKNHLQKILRKLGASNRAQAVAMAISMNLIPSHKAVDEP